MIVNEKCFYIELIKKHINYYQFLYYCQFQQRGLKPVLKQTLTKKNNEDLSSHKNESESKSLERIT